LDFARLRTGEIVAAIGGIALLVIMFLPWFELVTGGEIQTETIEIAPGVEEEIPTGGTEVDDSASAWDSLQSFDGFLIALAAVAGIALGVLAAAGRRLNLGPLPRGGAAWVLGSLATALILWRLFANPADLKYGIFLALPAAVAIAVGALLALYDDGYRPLVPFAGARSTAAATAPTAQVSTPPAGTTASRSSGARATTRRSTPKRSTAKRSTPKRSTARRTGTKRATSARSGSRGASKGSSRSGSRGGSSRGRVSSSRSSSRRRSSGGGSRRGSSG
jgi:hypothetical protein